MEKVISETNLKSYQKNSKDLWNPVFDCKFLANKPKNKTLSDDVALPTMGCAMALDKQSS